MPLIESLERRTLLAYLQMVAPGGFGSTMSYDGASSQQSTQITPSTLAANPYGNAFQLTSFPPDPDRVPTRTPDPTWSSTHSEPSKTRMAGLHFRARNHHGYGGRAPDGGGDIDVSDETGTVSDASGTAGAPEFGSLQFQVVGGPGQETGEPVSIEVHADYLQGFYESFAGQAPSQFSYYVGYDLGGASTQLLNGNDQNIDTALISNTVFIDAEVGETFGINALEQASASLKASYGYDIVTQLYVAIPPATVKMDDVAIEGTGSSISYDYETTDDPGSFTVALYFSPTSTYDPQTAVPVLDPETAEPAVQTVTPPEPDAPQTKGEFDFSEPPDDTAGLPYLLAVADPEDDISPADPSKAASVALPVVAAQAIQWHPSTENDWNADDGVDPETGDNAGGVDIQYTITGADLPQAIPMELYWANGSGDDVSSAIRTGDDGSPLMSETEVTATGDYDCIHVPAANLLVPPHGAVSLRLAFDPADSSDYYGLVAVDNEPDPSNTLIADAESILSPYQLDGNTVRAVTQNINDELPAEIDATFRPAGERCSLAQAAALLGVNHFNWEQTIVLKPASWTIYRSPSGQVLAQSHSGGGEDVVETQLYDPDTAANSVETFQESDGGGYPISTDGTPDVWPFYFNEPLSSDAAPLDKIMDESTLNFRDSASFHAFGANQYVGFDTQLVGVNLVNGSYISVPLNGTDIEFLWTTNATMANGGIIQNDYTRTFDTDNLPALASGGVIDVAYTTPLTFSPIANPTVIQGDPVSFTAIASDPRIGAVLTYSLAPGFPPAPRSIPATERSPGTSRLPSPPATTS